MAKYIISGGGTGGHIFPALSIANALRRRDPSCEILFVGALGRMEMERVPAAGYKIVGLPVVGFDRRKLWRNFAVLVKLSNSVAQARRIIKDFVPDAVIGVGGYASGPTLRTAQKLGIPTLIQEQNSYPGVTNRMLGRKACVICTAYENMQQFFPADRIVLTGNPVRSDLVTMQCPPQEARAKLGFDPERPLVLVVGGSLGARTLNESIAPHLEEITAAGASVMWQTGKLYADEFVPKADSVAHVKASPFISDMALAYRAATIVVARAGAGTISELQLLGKAAILVPSPNVAEDHQRKNAEALSVRGAAVTILDSDSRATLSNEILALLADKQRIASLQTEVEKMALRDSDEKIVDQLYKIISK